MSLTWCTNYEIMYETSFRSPMRVSLSFEYDSNTHCGHWRNADMLLTCKMKFTPYRSGYYENFIKDFPEFSSCCCKFSLLASTQNLPIHEFLPRIHKLSRWPTSKLSMAPRERFGFALKSFMTVLPATGGSSCKDAYLFLGWPLSLKPARDWRLISKDFFWQSRLFVLFSRLLRYGVGTSVSALSRTAVSFKTPYGLSSLSIWERLEVVRSYDLFWQGNHPKIILELNIRHPRMVPVSRRYVNIRTLNC